MLGLHSAYKLTEAGVKDVVVLEANDRIGGRINSVPMNGKWIEMGAQWIHGQGKNPLWKFVLEKQVFYLTHYVTFHTEEDI
jgi:monoamine oxidase